MIPYGLTAYCLHIYEEVSESVRVWLARNFFTCGWIWCSEV